MKAKPEAAGRSSVSKHDAIPGDSNREGAVPSAAAVDRSRLSIRRVVRLVPPWLVSGLLHLLLLVVLGICTMAGDATSGVLLVSNWADENDEELLEVEEIIVEPAVDPTNEPSFLQEDIVDTPAQFAMDNGPAVFTNSDLANAMAQLGDWSDDGRSMMGSGLGKGIGDSEQYDLASFFGTKARGNKFVFVVDNSVSMTNGKFETVLKELTKTVNSLSAEQQFYVVFFSDTAYRMFHPQPTTEYLPATGQNKDRLAGWLYRVELCMMTRGLEAFQIALEMNPDAIYVLGDGEFLDNTTAIMTAAHNRTIPIHTIGMEVDANGSFQLRAIAAANNGTYRDVRADVESRRQAYANPKRRNFSHGAVWGVNLGAMPRRR